MEERTRVRFGVFDFDLATGELSRQGVPVRLQAQPAQVLRILIEAEGELVSREALRASVWGSAIHVDFDRGLNFCISQIRRALRDNTESPCFVATVPKKGYRFIAPVLKPQTLPEAMPDAAPEAERPADGFSTRRRALAASIIGAGLFGAAWYWARSGRSVKVAVVRFDNETGDGSLDRLAGDITDSLVVELSASAEGKLGVIGNTAALWRPRAERNLTALAETLGAQFVILGQLRGRISELELLAHLIEMPDQTHRKVARFAPRDARTAAARIAKAFAPQLTTARTS